MFLSPITFEAVLTLIVPWSVVIITLQFSSIDFFIIYNSTYALIAISVADNASPASTDGSSAVVLSVPSFCT